MGTLHLKHGAWELGSGFSEFVGIWETRFGLLNSLDSGFQVLTNRILKGHPCGKEIPMVKGSEAWRHGI